MTAPTILPATAPPSATRGEKSRLGPALGIPISEPDPNGLYLERLHGDNNFCSLDGKRFRRYEPIPLHHVGFTRGAWTAREIEDGGGGFVLGLIQPNDVLVGVLGFLNGFHGDARGG